MSKLIAVELTPRTLMTLAYKPRIKLYIPMSMTEIASQPLSAELSHYFLGYAYIWNFKDLALQATHKTKRHNAVIPHLIGTKPVPFILQRIPILGSSTVPLSLARLMYHYVQQVRWES